MQLTHRVCSNCLFWSFITKRVNAGLVESICDHSVLSKGDHKFTRGSDKCGQWKKQIEELKYDQ